MKKSHDIPRFLRYSLTVKNPYHKNIRNVRVLRILFFLKFSSKSQTGYICLVLVISQNEVYQSGKKCLTKLLLGKLQFL